MPGKGDQPKVDETKEKEQVYDERHVDYLTPFLQGIDDISKITREQATEARAACLLALRERLLERANIIQKVSR